MFTLGSQMGCVKAHKTQCVKAALFVPKTQCFRATDAVYTPVAVTTFVGGYIVREIIAISSIIVILTLFYATSVM